MNMFKRLKTMKTHAFVARQAGVRALALGATLVGVLFSGTVSAAVLTYTFNGSFKASQTVGAFENALLVDAVAPLLGVGSSTAPKTFSVTVSLDSATVGVPAQSGFPGTQLYRAVTSSSSTFAGFSSIDQTCVGATSEFICTAQVFNGTGVFSGTGSDTYNLFASVGSSNEFEVATNETRDLVFQFEFFFLDIFGNDLTTNSVDVDLSLLDIAKMSGGFVVFAPTVGAPGFDRADFDLQIDSIVTGSAPTTDVPEPSQLLLLLASLGLLVIFNLRRRHIF